MGLFDRIPRPRPEPVTDDVRKAMEDQWEDQIVASWMSNPEFVALVEEAIAKKREDFTTVEDYMRTLAFTYHMYTVHPFIPPLTVAEVQRRLDFLNENADDGFREYYASFEDPNYGSSGTNRLPPFEPRAR